MESSTSRWIHRHRGLRCLRKRTFDAGLAKRVRLGRNSVPAERRVLLRLVRQLGMRAKDGLSRGAPG